MHVCASVRFRKNQIPCLNVDGSEVNSHRGKAVVLHDYFKALLGTQSTVDINFDLRNLLNGSRLNPSQALSLIRPFSWKRLNLLFLA